MLNLLQVEMRKLFGGNVYWVTVMVYIVAILGTFIPISFMGQEVIYSELHLESYNFFQAMYASNSGHFVVVIIFTTLFVFLDFQNGLLHRTLLCGYSRTQFFWAKFAVCYLGGVLYLMISIFIQDILGVGFYGMILNSEMISLMFKSFLAQCFVMLDFVAVSAAFAVFFGNGWSMLVNITLFAILPLPFLLAAYLTNGGEILLLQIMPTVSSTGARLNFNQMLGFPELWNPVYILGTIAVTTVLTIGFSAWGIRAFQRKQL